MMEINSENSSPSETANNIVLNNNSNNITNNGTTDFIAPTLPDTNYHTGTHLNTPLTRRILSEIHLAICLCIWYGLVASPFVLLGLLYFQCWKTLTVAMILLIWSYMPRFFPQWFNVNHSYAFRHFLFSWVEPTNQFIKGFTIHYSHSSLELFAYQNKPADYLSTPTSPPWSKPSVVDLVYPEDDFTRQHQAKYNIYNNIDTINSFPRNDKGNIIDYNKGNKLKEFYSTLLSPSSQSSSSLQQQQQQQEQSLLLQEHLNKPILIAGAPHGIFCVSFYYGGVSNRSLDRMNSNIKWCVADALTRMPYFDYVHNYKRKLYSASGDNVKKIMSNGENLSIVIGGFHEASIFEYNKHRLYIKKRFGFINYALKYGYTIIPMYAFGEEKTYYQPQFGPDSILTKIRMTLCDYNIPAILPLGKYGCTLLPMNDEPIHVVYGKPMFLPHIKSPTNEQVEYWHQKYIENMQELFNEWKVKLNLPKDTHLEIF